MPSDYKVLHEDILVWDAHRDVAHEAPLEKRFLQKWMVDVDLDLDLLIAGGIDVETYAVCTASVLGLDPTAQALLEFERILQIIDNNPDKIQLATTTRDVMNARENERIAAFLHFEGAEPIKKEIDLLRAFYRLGLRSIGLTWNFRNEVADGSFEGERGGGLSNFGRDVVREMNRLGMIIDIAHMTFLGMKEVISVSAAPVLLSHGAVGAVRKGHHRAYGDDVLEMIAVNGGIFCVTTIPEALCAVPSEATLSVFLDHIDHAVKVMGVDRVGLGADFDVYLSHLGLPADRWTKDLEEVDKWQNVTKGLLERGYKNNDVKKIMGDNLFRLYKQIVG
jgi:membrane dipeptidase